MVKKLHADITYLEMTTRAHRAFPRPTSPPVALMTANKMPVVFYRYLYEQVGKTYHWCARRLMDDKTLAGVIHRETTRIQVLYVNGSPGGFFELDLIDMPAQVEIAYFGIATDFVGMGLGKWFLASAIDAAWAEDPQKVTVHTCTLDHPAALPLYQLLGFEPVGTGVEEVEPWR